MTRDEAVRTLQSMKSDFSLPKAAQTRRAQNDALDVAIKVLEAEPYEDAVSRQAAIDLWEQYHPYIATKACEYDTMLRQLPSAQPEDWMERNKERILQAGMEGREIEFWIGGRLFAIREKAQ